MGLFKSKNDKRINAFTATENELRGDAKLGVISALEKDRLEITRELEELARQYAKISGLKKLGKRKKAVGNAENDFSSELI